MGNSKVIFGGETVIDLTSDTVAADKMMSGITAHNKAGNKITGTFTLDSEMSAQDTLIANIKTALEGKAAGGGSGGGEIVTGTFTITNNGMFEPGVNELMFSAPNLSISTRKLIIIICSDTLFWGMYRNDISEDFTYMSGDISHVSTDQGVYISNYGGDPIIGENELILYGHVNSSDIYGVMFIAT